MAQGLFHVALAARTPASMIAKTFHAWVINLKLDDGASPEGISDWGGALEYILCGLRLGVI